MLRSGEAMTTGPGQPAPTQVESALATGADHCSLDSQDPLVDHVAMVVIFGSDRGSLTSAPRPWRRIVPTSGHRICRLWDS